MSKRLAKPRSTGDLASEDIPRMIADWLTWSEQQRRVSDLTNSAVARSNAERYARLAQQAQALLDSGATFASPTFVQSVVPKPEKPEKPAKAAPVRVRKSRAKPPAGGLRCLNCGQRISRLEMTALNFEDSYQCCAAKNLQLETADV